MDFSSRDRVAPLHAGVSWVLGLVVILGWWYFGLRDTHGSHALAVAGTISVWTGVGYALHRGLVSGAVLGLATGITLFRAWLIAILTGFLFLPEGGGAWSIVPAGLYICASILDHLDGRLARRLNQVSSFGARLDMEVDAVGILVASVLAIQYGKLPIWFALVGMARYAFVGGMWGRTIIGRANTELPPSELRRLLAGFQMGFLSACLLPFVSSEATLVCSWVFAGATLSIFLRDWLFVCGWLDPQSTRYRNWLAQQAVTMPWILIAVRLSVGFSLLHVMLRAPLLWPAWLSWVTVAAFVLFELGKLARVGAAWLLAVLAVYSPYLMLMGVDGATRWSLLGTAVILMFGAGPLPIDRLLASEETGESERDAVRALT